LKTAINLQVPQHERNSLTSRDSLDPQEGPSPWTRYLLPKAMPCSRTFDYQLDSNIIGTSWLLIAHFQFST